MKNPAPSSFRYQRANHILVVAWGDDSYEFSAEFLRVHSPSAEVQGHAGEGGTLPVNKQNVSITAIEPVGNYAVKIVFDDGHQSGLFSWDWLRQLADNQQSLWQEYCEKSAQLQAEKSVDGVVKFMPLTPKH